MADDPRLLRSLGLSDCTAIVVGIVIGSGIFLTPGLITRDLPDPSLFLAVWVIGGLVSIAGALTFAELGAAMPDAGGPYVYLRRAYGDLAGFLFGWLTLLVYQTGAIAAVAAGFAAYLGHLVPAVGTGVQVLHVELGFGTWTISAEQVMACVAIVATTVINVRGVRSGSLTQNILTSLKVAALAAFIGIGFIAGSGGAFLDPVHAAPPRGVIAGMGVALIAVLWTFDGWNNLNFSSGEIRDPGRVIPRALVLGTSIATVVYVLMAAVYLYALPIAAMQDEPRIAEKTATVLFGARGAILVSLVVMVSTLGAVNGLVLTTARVFYAMARDGLLFRAMARVHPRFRTPHVSLAVQCAWSCALALSGSYDQLITYATFAALLTYAAAAASVFTLRRTAPDLPRPYRVRGYPWLPAVFLVAVGYLVINTLIERPFESLSGLGLLVAGVPVYLLTRRSS